jgi:hypothetical protein
VPAALHLCATALRMAELVFALLPVELRGNMLGLACSRSAAAEAAVAAGSSDCIGGGSALALPPLHELLAACAACVCVLARARWRPLAEPWAAPAPAHTAAATTSVSALGALVWLPYAPRWACSAP